MISEQRDGRRENGSEVDRPKRGQVLDGAEAETDLVRVEDGEQLEYEGHQSEGRAQGRVYQNAGRMVQTIKRPKGRVIILNVSMVART